MEKLKRVLEGSECHTLDRKNMRAQKECGVGDGEELDDAVRAIYMINYHQYVNVERV